MTAPPSGNTISLGERNAPNNAGEAATLSALNGANTSGITQTAAQSQDASDISHRNDPRTEGVRSGESGYERKIGRGTSWRRDHDSLGEEQYTVRGRGRGRGRPYRGRGGYPHYESRDYPDRRDYHPPAPGHPADPRGPLYPPDDPYYDSRGNYPPPVYDSRRDYPPDPSARYHEDYRRGYDSREFVPPPPTSMRPPMDSRRPYERGPIPGRGAEPSDYDRPYPRPRDPRDDFRGDPRIPRDEALRFPSDTRPPRDARADPRLIDEGRIPPPIEGRPREPLDSRRPLSGREYPRMSSREVDIPPSLESAVLSKMPEDSSVLARGGPRKNIADLGPDPFGNGVRAALDPRADEPSSYRYDRERPPPSERYRDAGDYGRDPYMAYEGRGRGLLPRDIRDAPYGRPRDSGAPYEDYPPLATESRARDTYPSRGPPPLDYSRIAAQEERYSRGPPVDLEPPRGRESGYRDLPGRSFDSGQKRRYDGDYVDRYGEDLRTREARYTDRYDDYPRPTFDVDERDPKRARAVDGGRPPPDPRQPLFRRPPPPDGRFGPRHDEDRSYTGHSDYIPRHERSRPNGRYFLAKTSTAENIAKSRETNRWGIAVKDVDIFREAFKSGPVTLLFALDESGRFCGYATMASDVGAVPPMAWMEEHCSPVGAAFEIKHMTTDDVRTTLTTKLRNHMSEGQPIRFGPDGQEISGKEAAGLVDELERMSGPENAEKRASAVVMRGGGPRGRGRGGDRGGRGSSGRGYYEGYRGRGRGRD